MANKTVEGEQSKSGLPSNEKKVRETMRMIATEMQSAKEGERNRLQVILEPLKASLKTQQLLQETEAKLASLQGDIQQVNQCLDEAEESDNRVKLGFARQCCGLVEEELEKLEMAVSKLKGEVAEARQGMRQREGGADNA